MPYKPENIDQLALDWIEAQTESSLKKGKNCLPVEYVLDLCLDQRFAELWQFIKATYYRPMSNSVFSVLAAGALEDLLVYKGYEYINQIEKLSREDARFKELLGGVWQNQMSEEIWNRVQKARGEPW